MQEQENIVPTREQDHHIYSFDLVRLLAALVVVVFHWGDFIIPGSPPPFSEHLTPVYQFGGLAVPLFFSLSGFIFTWLYSGNIYLKKINMTNFFALRIARLYPLYFVTFVAVSIITPFSSLLSFYTYPTLNNDAYHAFLNIFMLTGWGLEHGFSFNGPSWSVSTEIFLYGAFAIVARLIRLGVGVSLVMILLGFALTPVSVHLGGGLVQFFAGSIVYCGLQGWSGQRNGRWVVLSAIAAMLLVIAYAWEVREGAGLAFVTAVAPDMPNLEARYQIIRDMTFPTLFLSLSLFCLAAWETRDAVHSRLKHPLVRWAGDISYAVYLWHFPLMMIFATIAGISGLPPFVFYMPTTLIVYIVVLIGISHLSFFGFERPVMRMFRSRLRARNPDIANDAQT